MHDDEDEDEEDDDDDDAVHKVLNSVNGLFQKSTFSDNPFQNGCPLTKYFQNSHHDLLR